MVQSVFESHSNQRAPQPAEPAGTDRQRGTRLLLIVDDDAFLDRISCEARTAGYDVRHRRTPAAAITTCDALWSPQIVVLDQLVPRGERYAAIRALRGAFGVPILVISNDLNVTDSVFERGVLTASRDAVIAEARHLGAWEESPATVLSVDDLLLDRRSGAARYRGRNLDLTPDEVTTLATLMALPGEVVSRRALLGAIDGLQRDLDPRIVDVHVVRLMVKLGPNATVSIERTADRDGYLLRSLKMEDFPPATD